MIDPAIDHQILAHRIRNRPEIPYGVAALEWLREMPNLSGDRELFKGMRDGERLSELCSTHATLSLFRDDSVHIDVESVYVITHQE